MICEVPLNDGIVDVLSVTLRVPPSEITGDFSPAACETWDSVRHLMIMLAIEDKYGVRFDEKQIGALTSLAAIGAAVQAQLAHK
jgi:acyl carrier protein